MTKEQIWALLNEVFHSGKQGVYIPYEERGELHLLPQMLEQFSTWLRYKIHLVTYSNHAQFKDTPMEPNQIWVFEDLNNISLSPRDEIFYRAILNAHKNGGMVFVTSMLPLNTLLKTANEHLFSFPRRASELFGLSPVREKNIAPEKLRLFKHDKKVIEQLNDLVSTHKQKLTRAIRLELVSHYPHLMITGSFNSDDVVFHPNNLLPEKLNDLIIDLQFLFSHPDMAVENICCRFNNFEARTPLQQQMFAQVKSAAQAPDLKAAQAVFMQAESGSGKTHLAIALAKSLIERGLSVSFVTPQNQENFAASVLSEKQVWIFDDLESGELWPMSWIFCQAVMSAQENGGVLFATSNQDYESILAHAPFFGHEDSAAGAQALARSLFSAEIQAPVVVQSGVSKVWSYLWGSKGEPVKTLAVSAVVESRANGLSP